MKKAYRVKKNQDFQAIFRKKHSKANHQFIIYYLKKSDQSHARFAYSVSKKLGNAVVRNRIKRRIRHATMAILDEIDYHYDIVIIARKAVVTLPYEELCSSLRHVLNLAGLLKHK